MAGPPGRPLPLVTLENEFFWRSGADGRLRLAECESCSALVHPPQPVCRYCRGHQIGVRAASGFATLIGFTVNHRFSLPGPPAPYVVAQVAIEEDPRVRLTTNAVGCDPERLVLGMRMEVVFEQAGDAWLPLFRPAAPQGEPAPLPEDEIEPGRCRAPGSPWSPPAASPPAGPCCCGRTHDPRGGPRTPSPRSGGRSRSGRRPPAGRQSRFTSVVLAGRCGLDECGLLLRAQLGQGLRCASAQAGEVEIAVRHAHVLGEPYRHTGGPQGAAYRAPSSRSGSCSATWIRAGQPAVVAGEQR